MYFYNYFRILYYFFRARRWILYGAFVGGVVLSIIAFRGLRVSEDIKSMLPDDPSGVAADFELLQHTPFARKIIISLKSKSAEQTGLLIDTADRLAEALSPPMFTRVMTGPPVNPGMDLFFWIIRALPSVTTSKDLKKISSRLSTEKIHGYLTRNYELLQSPEGWFMKPLIQIDPLELRQIGLVKLRFLNIFPGMRLQEEHFISPDGRNVLLMAETPVDITDATGSAALLDYLRERIKAVVPESLQVSFISAHRYTLANAQTIKKDLIVVMFFSVISILLLFFWGVKSGRAFFVFLIPLSVLCIAAVGVSFFYDPISAITIGFGSVLLGLSVDFALHVYFALRAERPEHAYRDSGTITAEVAHPVLFGGLTTMGAFSVLLFSSLPGQRQLAVFSIIGIGTALFLSLILLPHLVHTASRPKNRGHMLLKALRSVPSRPVLVLWGVLLLVCLWQGTRVRFNGEMDDLNVIPPELRAVEQELKKTWGHFQGHAMAFSEGADLESALRINERLFQLLAQKGMSQQVISLAPILPSEATQKARQKAWDGFWTDSKKSLVRQRLKKQGTRMGFSENAFSPFFEKLDAPSQRVSVEDLKQCGFGELLDALVIQSGNKFRVLTLIPDTPEMNAVFNQNKPRLKGVRFVSQTRFGEKIGRAIGNDFISFIIKAFILVVILLGFFFRDLKKMLVALIPVGTGLVFMFGIMGGLGTAFNPFNIIAVILIIGLGVDYGIFMVCKISENYAHDTDQAVLFSGLTTMAGFGALILARHPAMHSIGLTVILGIGAAIPSALFVIPALYKGETL